MPRFGSQITTSVVFMYPSVEHAQRHDRIGGTGLIVGKLMEGTGLYATYLVTCRHVALAGSPVARINRRDDEKPDIIDLLDVDYVPHPNGVDLAIHPLFDHLKFNEHAYSFANVASFMTPELMVRHDIGLGDDIFMVGRFVNLQGNRNNVPSVRTGNFSHNLEKVRIGGLNQPQTCFAVEMRSRTGFSGSPVYVWGTRHTALARKVESPEDTNFIYLLGINVGYIIDPNASSGEENTWLNAVIPAWRILDLFETRQIREAHELKTRQTADAIKVLRSISDEPKTKLG